MRRPGFHLGPLSHKLSYQNADKHRPGPGHKHGAPDPEPKPEKVVPPESPDVANPALAYASPEMQRAAWEQYRAGVAAAVGLGQPAKEPEKVVNKVPDYIKITSNNRWYDTRANRLVKTPEWYKHGETQEG